MWKMGGFKLIEDWKMVSDNKDYLIVLFIDKGKVFDLLYVVLMIQKFKVYGFNEILLNFL